MAKTLATRPANPFDSVPPEQRDTICRGLCAVEDAWEYAWASLCAAIGGMLAEHSGLTGLFFGAKPPSLTWTVAKQRLQARLEHLRSLPCWPEPEALSRDVKWFRVWQQPAVGTAHDYGAYEPDALQSGRIFASSPQMTRRLVEREFVKPMLDWAERVRARFACFKNLVQSATDCTARKRLSDGGAGNKKSRLQSSSPRTTKQAMAIGLLYSQRESADWTDKKLAAALGVHEKSISRWTIFQELRESVRQGRPLPKRKKWGNEAVEVE